MYYRWHGLWVPKAHSVELPRDEPTNILACLEQENNQMHLKGKVQERAIKSISKVTASVDEKDISSNDNFQKFLPMNIRRCC